MEGKEMKGKGSEEAERTHSSKFATTLLILWHCVLNIWCFLVVTL